MSEPMTKSELVELIRAEHEALEAQVAGLREAQMIGQGVVGQWDVKDILAHVSVWETRMVRWLDETVRGVVPQQLPPGISWEDIDQWNEQTVLEHRHRPLTDVLAGFRDSYRQALEAVEQVRELDLTDPQRFEWRGGTPLWEMVAANTFWHYREHRESIQGWLDQLSASL